MVRKAWAWAAQGLRDDLVKYRIGVIIIGIVATILYLRHVLYG